MSSQKKILGVCQWLSFKFDLDVTLVRILFVVGAFLSLGTAVIVYIILALVKPK